MLLTNPLSSSKEGETQRHLWSSGNWGMSPGLWCCDSSWGWTLVSLDICCLGLLGEGEPYFGLSVLLGLSLFWRPTFLSEQALLCVSDMQSTLCVEGCVFVYLFICR